MEENQSEKNQKYRDLKKREETMDAFLMGYDNNKAQELDRINELQVCWENLSIILKTNYSYERKSAFSRFKLKN